LGDFTADDLVVCDLTAEPAEVKSLCVESLPPKVVEKSSDPSDSKNESSEDVVAHPTYESWDEELNKRVLDENPLFIIHPNTATKEMVSAIY
jgi:hypothetical protein